MKKTTWLLMYRRLKTSAIKDFSTVLDGVVHDLLFEVYDIADISSGIDGVVCVFSAIIQIAFCNVLWLYLKDKSIFLAFVY